MNRQSVAVAGAVVLLVGVFTPVISLPVVGQQNLFQNGREDGVFFILLAIVGMVAALTRRFRWLLPAGAIALGLIAYKFWTIQSFIHSMRVDMERELAGNPFRGLGEMMLQSVQLQWGWIVLAAGAILLMLSGFAHDRDISGLTFGASSAASHAGESETVSRSGVVLLVALLAAGGIYFFFMQRQRAAAELRATVAREEAAHERIEEERKRNAEEAAEEMEKREALSMLRLEDFEWDSSRYSRAIVGTVVNGSSRRLRMVKVEFGIEDNNGNLLDTTSDYLTAMGPGERWRFRCHVAQRGELMARLRDLTARVE